MYCLKRKIGVIPDGRCVFMSNLFDGSTGDMTVCASMHSVYEDFVTKALSEYKIRDQGSFNKWAIMADKGYVGLDKVFRTVVPKKKNMRSQQPAQTSESQGSNVSQISGHLNSRSNHNQRVIVENYFGRLKN
ncbi:hypothetical protein BB558_007374, partial [Smittium angustum]